MQLPRRIGPFLVGHRLGQGGMGAVYAADHADTGWAVAVKLVARDEAFTVVALAREARAIAALDHRNVVAVFDQGVTEAGVPYLVMERARATVADRLPMAWDEARRVLDAVLCGLSHSHARGILHYDLKPSNILQFDAPGGDRYALADFGLSRRRGEKAGRRAGSPPFMAPERFSDDNPHSPASDLYSVGCVAWALLAGRPPFDSEDLEELVWAHRQQALPPMPDHAVSAGLREWLEHLLAKDPAHRFATAADARWALAAIPDAVATLPGQAAPARGTATLTAAGLSPAPLPALPRSDRDRTAPRRPRATWAEAAADARGTRVPDGVSHVGLGLVGLREPPFVGRHDERRRIWDALVDPQPRVALVRGAAGIGTSRLGSWVVRRCTELGVGDAWSARVDGTDRWMVALAASALGCSGEDLHETWARIQALPLPFALRRPTLALVHPDDPVEEVGHRFGSTAQRLAALTRLVGALAPAVLWLDDLPANADAGRWFAALSNAGPPGLLIATAHAGAVQDDPAWEALAADPRALRVELGPLTGAAWYELVHDLLGLAGETASLVATRASGNPGIAVDLVQTLVSSGRLRPGRGGWSLPHGNAGALTTDRGRLWAERVAVLWPSLPPAAAEAVAVAGALDEPVDPDLWSATAPGADEAADRLERAGLIRWDHARVRFVHPAARDAVRTHLRDSGRWADVHLACARAVLDHPRVQRVDRSVRAGRHLLEAGRPEDAFDALMGVQGANTLTFSTSLSAVRLAQAALDQLGVDPADPRRAQLLSLRASELVQVGRLAEAEDAAGAALAHPAIRPRDRGLAMRAAATVVSYRGDKVAASERYAALVDFAAAHGLVQLEARASIDLASVLNQCGQGAEARRVGHRAGELAAQIGDGSHLAPLLYLMGVWAVQDGRLDAAERDYRRGLALAKDRVMPVWQGIFEIGLGTVARRTARAGEAVELLSAAVERLDTVGSNAVWVARIQLAAALASAGDPDRGWEIARRAAAAMDQAGRRHIAAAARVSMLYCAAVARRWAGWDRLFDACVDGLTSPVYFEPEVFQVLDEIVAILSAVPDPPRAAAVRALLAQLGEQKGEPS